MGTLNRLQQKFEHKHQTNNDPGSMDTQPTYNNNNKPMNNTKNRNFSMVVLYIHGLGEKFKKTCKNKGIQIHFKGTNAVKTLHLAPKDRDNKLHKSGIIFKFKYPHVNCPEENIWRIWQNIRGQGKGTPQGPISLSTNTATLQDIQSVQTASP